MWSSITKGSQHLITIVAHRGLHDVYPENSLPAFDAARTAGIDWVEFDVRSSSDGVPVIIHDETLERTAEATGRIDEKSSGELRQIRLKGARGYGSEWRIPVGSHMRWGSVIEIKPSNAKKLVETVVESMMPRGHAFERAVAAGIVLRRPPLADRWILQSFDSQNLIYAWTIAPTISAAWLIDENTALEIAIREQWPAVHVRHDLLNESVVAAMRNAKMSIGAWTVNEEMDIRRIVLLRPDLIISDAPLKVRRIISKMRSQGICECKVQL